MTRRTAALAAALLAVPALLFPGAPAQAQVCQPPSAEHAFEELLDLAPDDTPLEDEAWRIADEQEAKGTFETAETIRRIDDLARANGYVYQCVDRMYHPVSGPDPREAIENGQEPPETGGGSPGGNSGQPTPGVAGPEAGADGSVGGLVGTSAEAGASASGPGGPAPSDGARQGDRDTPGAQGTDGAISLDGVPRPDGAPDGEGGAVALSDGTESAGRWRTVGIVFLAGAAIVVAGAVRTTRRRPHLVG